MSLRFRLQILEESSQISPLVASLTESVIRRVEEHYGIRLTEENGAVFVTHLAVALERIRTGQAIDRIPQEVLNEVRGQSSVWRFMTGVAEELAAKLGVPIPEAELGFLTAHLAVLVKD